MNKLPKIQIPEGIYYLGDYPQALNCLPSGKFILNKVMTGCGATTLFLDDPVATVLCSPRKELLHCKAYSDRYLGKVHLFGDIGSDAVIDKINAAKAYIGTCGLTPFSPVPKVPKILVTYDSTKHVIQALGELGIIDRYRFVVDEFQTLWTDAAFRGDTEAEFMQNLNYASSVVFLSATPYLEKYLDMSTDFSDLPYVELEWPQSSLQPTKISTELYYNGSRTKTIKRIIGHYKAEGFFEEMMDAYGNKVKATQAVFFVNDVRFISNTIRSNGLSPSDVNIICSDREENHKALRRAGLKVGHAPREGEPHATYTFATKASYEGTDFYSPCAYTYIFSDIRRDWLAMDISLDLPQIMGRQRLVSNPFRYSATLFVKTVPEFTEEEKRLYMENIKRKDDDTKAIVQDFESFSSSDQKSRFARKLRFSQKVERYQNDYVSVVDDKTSKEPVVVYNEYVMLNELRAWEVQMHQYTDITYVMGCVDNAFVGNASVTYKDVSEFLSGFRGTFEQRMKMYAEFLDANPGCREELQRTISIPNDMKHYYNELGTDTLRSLKWRESVIQSFLEQSVLSIDDEIRAAFPESWYSLSDIKQTLQDIYDRNGTVRTAKATDLKEYMRCRDKKRVDENGNRQNGYEITQNL